jgi:hypothetical protein
MEVPLMFGRRKPMDEYNIKMDGETRYRDKITGFEGVVTARYEYLHGCTRIELAGMVNGEPKSFVFDAPQIVEVATQQEVTSRRTGGPHGSTPVSR